MAATFNIINRGREGEGDMHAVIFDITPDNSYPTGGYPLPAVGGAVLMAGGSAKGYMVGFDPATGKLLFYRQTAATGALVEVTNGVDISAIGACRLLAVVAE